MIKFKKVAIFFIKVYQKFFSFDHAFWANPEKFRVCIYQPSCSEYTVQAIDKFGTIKGLWLGFRRILRCNPFNEPRYDPVPEK